MYFATVDLAGISFFRETHLPHRWGHYSRANYEVHIPKSAGSSFALDAQDILRPLHLISQEGCLSLHHGNLLKFLQHFLRFPQKNAESRCHPFFSQGFKVKMKILYTLFLLGRMIVPWHRNPHSTTNCNCRNWKSIQDHFKSSLSCNRWFPINGLRNNFDA